MRLWEFIFQDNAHKIFHDSTIFEVFFLKGTFLKLLVTYLTPIILSRTRGIHVGVFERSINIQPKNTYGITILNTEI